LQCGAPPTASIPKTHDQPEEANSTPSRPCGNNASTGISPLQPIRQATRGLTNDRQHATHLDVDATAASTRTKHQVNVKTGRPRPAANYRRAAAKEAVVRPIQSWRAAMAANCQIGIYQNSRAGLRGA
jgi:hypothetical protein